MSLFNSISISMRALLAEQAALDTTTNNIANANTPGYTRRRVVLQELSPNDGTVPEPRGVTVAGIQSLRDKVLELRIVDQVQLQSRDQAIADSMSPVELLFGDSKSDIGDTLSAFFNSISSLSTDASDQTLRQNVLTAASNFVDAVHRSANQLGLMQQNLDRSVVQSVQDVNQLTSQIAAINTEVAAREKLGQDPAELGDRRTLLTRELAELIDVNVIEDSSGLAITTSNGTALVVGSESFALDASIASDGRTNIYSMGSDITSTIKNGKLGGLLQVRDTQIVNLRGDLDQLASSFATAMNTANRSGFDLSGGAGGDLFMLPATVDGSATTFALATKNPEAIAASSDGTVGGNGNVSKLLAVQSQQIVNDMTPSDVYADIVFRVGTHLSNAQADAESGDLLVRQLDDARGAISGVNNDEEATNLIRFQRAYQAAARVVQVINDLSEIAVNLGRN